MSRRSRARRFALAGIGLAAALLACNAIVGVEDVTLKKGGTGRDSGEITDPGDQFTPPPDEPIDSKAAAGRPNVLTVVLGEAHTCARKMDFSVKCWGDDSQGQNGTGGTAADAGVVASAIAVKGIDDAIDIAAGRRHTCVARKSGKVSCWGFNPDGQLGNGDTGRSTTPVDALGINNAFAVAAGGNFSCAVRGSGGVACWGGNANGQLGRGDTTPSVTPVVVPGLSNVISIAAGQSHACAVKSDGSVVCWGNGQNGQLGTGNASSSPKPVAVQSLPAAVAVAAGERSTCALTETGAVLCWGANEVGQLGTGAVNATPNPSPITVASLSDAVAIGTGPNHTCAVRKDGRVVCWGDGDDGQLGDGVARDAGSPQAKSVDVVSFAGGFRVGAGLQHSCATTNKDEIFCWGANDRGQLGNATVAGTLKPVAVAGFP